MEYVTQKLNFYPPPPIPLTCRALKLFFIVPPKEMLLSFSIGTTYSQKNFTPIADTPSRSAA